MNLNDRIIAFSKLGEFINKAISDDFENNNSAYGLSQFYSEFSNEIENAEINNRWFSKKEVLFALSYWGQLLSYDSLSQWTKAYVFNSSPKNIGVVQAGNIPLVGFHDFLSVLISGHSFMGKTSTKDDKLPKFLSKVLLNIEPQFKDSVLWTDRLVNYDAVIATGSNNTSRYFEYYFGQKPNIIRGNRASWAILTGHETDEELFQLGHDIFRYYGLGCRNISKLFVPENYNFEAFFKAIEPFSYVYDNNKYANNYDYNQSIYLMNLVDFLQNGFLILKEEIGHHSPLSVVYFEKYKNIESVFSRIENEKENIQCICGSFATSYTNIIPFGQAQIPQLWDYADDINTLEFLSNL